MSYKFRSLFNSCLKAVVDSSHLSRSVTNQSKVSKVVACSISSPSLCNKNLQSFESRSIGCLDRFYSNSKITVPNVFVRRIHHLGPRLNRDADKPVKQTGSTNQVTDSRTKDRTENTDADKDIVKGESLGDDQVEEIADKKPQGLLERFKQTYKEYGKVLVGVHVFTSCIWATSFYYLAASGIDIIALLKWLGAGEKIIASLSVPGVGYAAIAYLLYKLASPLRYAVTIAGTRVAVNVFRRWGYLPSIPEKNRIRSLVKEGQQKMKAKYDDIKKSN